MRKMHHIDCRCEACVEEIRTFRLTSWPVTRLAMEDAIVEWWGRWQSLLRL